MGSEAVDLVVEEKKISRQEVSSSIFNRLREFRGYDAWCRSRRGTVSTRISAFFALCDRPIPNFLFERCQRSVWEEFLAAFLVEASSTSFQKVKHEACDGKEAGILVCLFCTFLL